jgi:hypothetical protein
MKAADFFTDLYKDNPPDFCLVLQRGMCSSMGALNQFLGGAFMAGQS